eukprot:3858433-Rhodomonas_salina.2
MAGLINLKWQALAFRRRRNARLGPEIMILTPRAGARVPGVPGHPGRYLALWQASRAKFLVGIPSTTSTTTSSAGAA